MLVSIHQPETLPWLAFFDKIDQSDLFILLDNVQFEKNYFQNRFKVRDGRGGTQLLTLPLAQAPLHALINERVIALDNKTLSTTCNALKERYRKSPFFETYYAKIRELVMSESNLARSNIAMIRFLMREIGVNGKLVLASDVPARPANGGAEVVFELSRAVGATTYLSGKMGREYLDRSMFEAANIQVIYHAYECVPYPQPLDSPFIPYLSGVDLLFNCGANSVTYLREGRLPNEEH